MKQYIVLMSMICLGVFLYGLISGDSDTSILSTLKSAWQYQAENY
jgi:hypothetical protein